MTLKIEKVLKEQQLENTLLNIEKSSSDIANTLNQINQSYPKVNDTIAQTKNIMCDISAITCGIRKTLSKNFGLMKRTGEDFAFSREQGELFEIDDIIADLSVAFRKDCQLSDNIAACGFDEFFHSAE